ncbi:hypothetical protein J5N97_017542 [Dioscorea zingiberensis]|uniref:Uncharacterized protein n=1 Tax=Dioscorea zingiberensis TaxID=325984 RepID=A0A9D5CM61_9LILI|nr:hypothetical protein J5N97_017542 [Dioscorea zingiberensis]
MRFQSVSTSSRLPKLVPLSSFSEKVAGDNNGSSASQIEENEGNGYRLPPKEIETLLMHHPFLCCHFSPQRDKILFLKRRSLPPLSDLARPEEKLAGVLGLMEIAMLSKSDDDENSSKMKVWVADVETGSARPLFQSPDIYLNAIFDK